ncbi:cardiolipin synthase A [Komagataeibacter rhaeticus]|uniref:Cardiolipin synthase n=1 Tax=Komagataeibacter rhaeticus TaxID=215221 RepID=A0A181CE88_9PROT|nr:cardiolipin synthase [Komagataeibacter rhaeticus]ATU71488.1 cardiolipin synthase [Komagataeibacter xylinus]KDU96242.1 cardiolipin synthase [Komagataeibacter rhaeticus AF1]MBL7240368.1 cardiolipin synthase [Komagataeibacter rhaeticus]PYD53105.1 cardiolipin synthase A [Komagataeibacter rhaeticus]QIP36446.1 cardiolipin synthase [Komagataeibacter rhaeticus]
MQWGWVDATAIIGLQVMFIIRVLLRPHRQPASRVAWVAIIGSLPIVGMLAYLLLGETHLDRHIMVRIRRAIRQLPIPGKTGDALIDAERDFGLHPRLAPLFRVGQSISGYPPMGSNRASLMADSDAAIDAMVADIDTARAHVHISFYIWLADNNGMKVIAALKRAAARGVTCRVMADDLGSRRLVHSHHWADMAAAGVRLVRALPIGNPLQRPFRGRFDMRNHRKIVVIDSRVTYCGSQNCADAAFRVKARFAPWVDLVARFEGPVVLQNQHLFATDWTAHTDEDLTTLLTNAPMPKGAGFVAQVIGTSAAVRYAAMPEVFVSLMNAAARELTITTPYYVPDEPIQAALCAAARRGVKTTLTVPLRNDSWIVAGASRSYYRELLEAGVTLYEYPHGLLHTKALTVDGHMTMIGSANLDRRSFDLNFENNILLVDEAFTATIHTRQQDYIKAARPVTLEDVLRWPAYRVLWNNVLAMVGPVL